ncbi:hypothetical protein C7S18_01975 [Ahniella affigens]|uniref:Uncharacterized protein n=1 Tax=Ahniella affigens TaxID=2021234 RepID=A0A2P1PYP9_9GAMM|nr:hypothetical protein C7S18_01975 [Ahniella affigens]
MIGAGGTPGGIPMFLIGVALTVLGGYLLTNQVTVTSGPWLLYGQNAFGMSLLPFLFGVGLLFFNGRSIWGWLLLGLGLLIIFAGIIVNLRIYFEPASLFSTLMMLGLLAAGLGLTARSLKSL